MSEQHLIYDMVMAMSAAIHEFYAPMEVWLMFAVALTITDLRFGVKAARHRGEVIRTSRMWRRSLNKLFDYFCWVTVAGLCGRTIGVVLGVPVTSIGMFLIVYGIEISSCFNNYFEYKGIQKKFDFWKLINRPAISSALEDTCGATKKNKTDDTEQDTD